jgi:hypothetical protein
MKNKVIIICFLIFGSKAIYSQFGTDTASYYIERAYTELISRDLYSVTHWILGECRSDNSEVGGEPGGHDQPHYQNLMLFDYQASNIKVETFWYRAYNIIYLCNKTIELAPDTDLDESVIEQYIAEAKFIRSLVLFELSITFDSIPICTSFYNWRLTGTFSDYDASVRIHQQPGSMAEVFSQIEQDLDDAIDVLPLRSELSGENIFRATKGAAQALMAKMYIFQSSYAKNYSGDPRFNGLTEQWAQALQYAESVISSSEYDLMGIDGETFNTWWDNSYLFPAETQGYRYIFTADGNDSPESVFSAKNLIIGNGWKPYGNCDLTVYTTCREFLDYESNTCYLGWGFNLPTQNLIDAFAEETGNEKDDPRFAVTVAYDGDSIYAGNPSPDWYELVLPEWATGTSCRKFECSPQEYWNIMVSYFDGPMNVPVIRYADVVLWAAEAAFVTGDNTKALNYINMVRQRARNSGSTGHPAELMSVTMDDIIQERRLELALEGHRFYDLVRWNLASENLDGLYRVSQDQTVAFVTGTHEFLPIPEGALVTGVYEKYKDNCNIFPNPVKDKLYVESAFNKPVVTVYDIYGRTILKKEFSEGNFRVNTGELPRGLYFISLETKDSHINLSFVKE